MDEGKGLFAAGSIPAGYREHLEPVLFRPWAERLLDFAGVKAGQRVLDVASGTGVVARAAAARVGTGGHVIASDISPAMLAWVSTGLEPGSAPVETLECPATDLAVDDEAVDVVLCQQGLPFIPDRRAAVGEMRRVLRPGGRVGIAVWLSNPRLEPFIIYGEALRDHGVPEPFPNAYDTSALSMTPGELRDALVTAGFVDVEVVTDELAAGWPGPDAAAAAVAGTPYGPVLSSLGQEDRAQVMDDIRRRMTAGDGAVVRHVTTAVLGRGAAG